MLSLKNYPILNRTYKEILRKKEYDEKYIRLLNHVEKDNLLLKDEIGTKYKVTNILLENFSDRVPQHSNYISSKNTKVSIKPISKLKIIYKRLLQVTITIIANVKENDRTRSSSISIS